MKIYISGPITGRNPEQVKLAFDTAEQEIRSKGHEPVNPYKLQTILDPATTDWAQYMHVALSLVKVCDAIYMLPGWKRAPAPVMSISSLRRSTSTFFTA